MKEWSNLKKGLFFGVVIIAMVFILCLNGAKAKVSEEDQAADKPVYWIANYDLAVRMMEENSGYVIIDARTEEEYAKGHLKDAVCMPPDSFNDAPRGDLPDLDQMIFVYAKNSKDCKTVCEHLAKAGYTQAYYIGPINKWKDKFVN